MNAWVRLWVFILAFNIVIGLVRSDLDGIGFSLTIGALIGVIGYTVIDPWEDQP